MQKKKKKKKKKKIYESAHNYELEGASFPGAGEESKSKSDSCLEFRRFKG